MAAIVLNIITLLISLCILVKLYLFKMIWLSAIGQLSTGEKSCVLSHNRSYYENTDDTSVIPMTS